MNKYNFYAKPKDDNDNIIVIANDRIHTLKFILLHNGLYKYYTLVDEVLTEQCFVEEYNSYKILRLGWTDNCKEGWYDEDTIPFSIILGSNRLINGLKEFINKPFNKKDFINKLEVDSDFKYSVENILGRDIDYVDMYFDRNEN